MEWIYATGGREKYFKGKHVGDCVTRAICNATGKDYKEVYDAINKLAKNEHLSKHKRSKSSARSGVYKTTYKKYLSNLGYIFVPTMLIGSGCTVHLNKEELPSTGTYIISVSGHLTCIKDGVLYDTFDCSREGTRCVYGYWKIA